MFLSGDDENDKLAQKRKQINGDANIQKPNRFKVEHMCAGGFSMAFGPNLGLQSSTKHQYGE